jgi:hypothetical protein
LIGRFSIQSQVPLSRSRTACFHPTVSARRLKFTPSGECRGDAVKDGSDELRRLEAHRLDRLVDDELRIMS